MLRLLQFLFLGHVHKWKKVDEWRMARSTRPDDAIGKAVFCVCEGCGKHKRFDLI